MRHRSGVSAILWHLFSRRFSGHGWRSWIMGFGWNSRSSHLGVGNEVTSVGLESPALSGLYLLLRLVG